MKSQAVKTTSREFDQEIKKLTKKEKELILKWIDQSKHDITLRDWLLRVAYDWQNGRAYELELQGPINLKEELNK